MYGFLQDPHQHSPGAVSLEVRAKLWLPIFHHRAHPTQHPFQDFLKLLAGQKVSLFFLSFFFFFKETFPLFFIIRSWSGSGEDSEKLDVLSVGLVSVAGSLGHLFGLYY